MKRSETRKNSYTGYLMMTVVLAVITMIACVLIFRFYFSHFTAETDAGRYENYYVMIAENSNDSLWQSIYEGAYEAGIDVNSYVDLLNGSFDNNYSKEDLMRIAIASQVDGIIVAADKSAGMTELIDEAAGEGIPVVTLYGDNTHSRRCTFVGIGSYDLGREYGKEVLEIVQEKQALRVETDGQGETAVSDEPDRVEVAVLVNAHAQDYGQNILCSGIQDTIEKGKKDGMDIRLTLISIDDTNAFFVEESIRDIFMEGAAPDIIVCLNELNTVCVYRAVVDYNRVGQVNILGYYDSETILKAIERNVIYATVSIDTEQMGRYCVDALTEYHTTGNTSQYFMADIKLINRENVEEHMREVAENDK